MNFKRIIKYTLWILLISVVFCLTLLIYWSPQSTSPFKDKNGEIIKSSIASIENVEINRIEQRLVIRGIDTLQPVVLHLHGGPGAPDRNIFKLTGANIEDLATVVYWDQRGTGGSYDKDMDPSYLSLDQIANDGITIAKYLKQRFNKEKIYLHGHSWGSVVGVTMAQRRPDLFHAYIGIGQLVNAHQSEKISYDYALSASQKAGNQEDIKILESIGPPPYKKDEWVDKLMQQRQVMWKYENPSNPNKQTMFQIYMSYIMHKEYSISDKLGMLYGSDLSMKRLWGDVMNTNFFESASEFDIPVHIIQGEYDKHTVTELAQSYFDSLSAPSKMYYEFEKAAHAPHISNYQKYRKIMKEILK